MSPSLLSASPPSNVHRLRVAVLGALLAGLAVGCASKSPGPAISPPSPDDVALSDEPLRYAADYPSARALSRAPAGRHWSNVAMPIESTWALLLAQDAREAWETYVAIPPNQRDRAAFTRTMGQTETLCRTQLQCSAEARVRTSFALQGWYEGMSLLEWRGELWAASPRYGADCASRVAELRRDVSIAPSVAGVVCGAARRSLEEGDETGSAGAWHRFSRDVLAGEPRARR